MVNYTDAETPYTRIIEHKHFAFGTQSKTVISREYSTEWHQGDEPYYPVNDEKNGALYAKYKALDVYKRQGGSIAAAELFFVDLAVEAVAQHCPPAARAGVAAARAIGVNFDLFHLFLPELEFLDTSI